MADEKTDIDEEAKKLGVSKSRIRMPGIKSKDKEKETKKHEKLVATRTANRIEKKKAEAKLKPVDKRKALLEARLRKVAAGNQATNYTNETINSWVDELAFIKKSPAAWKKGCMKGGKQPSLKDKIDAVMRP